MFPKTCCNMFQPGSRHNIYQRRNHNFAAAAALACRCFWLFNGILSKFGVRYKAIPHNSKCRYGERGAADAVPQLPERCLSRKAGIVRCCHNAQKGNAPDSQGAFPFYFLTYPFMRFTAVPSQTGTEWLRCRGGRAGRWYPGNRDGWGHQGNPGFPGIRRNTGRKMRHPCRRWRT